MKEIFTIYDSICAHYSSKNDLIGNAPQINNNIDEFLYRNLKTNGNIDPIKLVLLIGLVHQKNKEETKFSNTDERKHYGIYYTDYSIAKLIAKEALTNAPTHELINYKFLEPCSGIGIFALAYLDYIIENNPLAKHNIQGIINNIFFADLDIEAINIAKKLLPLYIAFKYQSKVRINEHNFYIGNILFDIENGAIVKKDPKDIFGIKNGFDVVLTNPPYKLLKENIDKYSEDHSKSGDLPAKKLVEYIKQKEIYKLNEGTLNYYKIFVEEIITNYTNDTGLIGLLIPITLLSDKQSKKLRKKILENFKLSNIYIIPEKNSFFPDICQAFCFFALDKSLKGEFLEINPSCITPNDFNNYCFKISLKEIKQVSDSMPVIIEEKKGWDILNKLEKNPKLRYFNSIHNLRGELDLTLDKLFITDQKTDFPLLRGNNISEFRYDFGELYVKQEFLNKLNGKRKYVGQQRLVCQQISNIHSQKRLKFTKIPSSIILGNSCNFISIENNLIDFAEISLDYMLGLLNSLVLDWRFKITNSNNHVSNYEISELPIAIPSASQKETIEKLVKNNQKFPSTVNKARLNMEIFKLYQLDDTETSYILDKYTDNELTESIKDSFLYAI